MHRDGFTTIYKANAYDMKTPQIITLHAYNLRYLMPPSWL